MAAATAGTCVCRSTFSRHAHVQEHLRIVDEVGREIGRAFGRCSAIVRSTFSAVHRPSPVNR